MHIKKAQFKNIAMFDDITVDFDEEINTIVGVNGSGKTIFMKLIYCVFNDDVQEILNYCNNDKASISLTIRLGNDENARENVCGLNLIYENVLLNQFLNNSIGIDQPTLEAIKNANFFGDNIVIEYICNKIYYDSHRYNVHLTKKTNDNLNDLYYKLPSTEQFVSMYWEAKEKVMTNVQNLDKTRDLIKERMDEIKTMSKPCALTQQYFSKNYNDHFVCRDYTDFRNGLKRYFSDKISYTTVDGKHNAKERLYEIKNTNTKMYLTIRDKFHEITGSHFDMISIVDKTELDYKTSVSSSEYYNIKENSKHLCSYGEIELINFLTSFCSNEQTIMLLDEPCNHLSYQRKLKVFRTLFHMNKQIIFITHNAEFVQPLESRIIYFGVDRNEDDPVSYVVDFPKYTIEKTDTRRESEDVILETDKYHKSKYDVHLTEYTEMLFADKCLLVEGKSDERLIKALFKSYGIHDYCIIKLNGCSNKTCYRMLNNLRIPFKTLYDYDVIKKQCENKSNNTDHTNYLKLKKITAEEYQLSKCKSLDEYLKIINRDSQYDIYFWDSNIETLEGVVKHIIEFISPSSYQYIIDEPLGKNTIKDRMNDLIFDKYCDMTDKYVQTLNDCPNDNLTCVIDFIKFMIR